MNWKGQRTGIGGHSIVFGTWQRAYVRHSDAMRKSILQMRVSVLEQVHVRLGESELFKPLTLAWHG